MNLSIYSIDIKWNLPEFYNQLFYYIIKKIDILIDVNLCVTINFEFRQYYNYYSICPFSIFILCAVTILIYHSYNFNINLIYYILLYILIIYFNHIHINNHS